MAYRVSNAKLISEEQVIVIEKVYSELVILLLHLAQELFIAQD